MFLLSLPWLVNRKLCLKIIILVQIFLSFYRVKMSRVNKALVAAQYILIFITSFKLINNVTTPKEFDFVERI